ncbi:MAG: hypothetical protein K2N87_07305 [Eubacterium sp.]|nr:hypothetical protein [Eubacterium sp.]
MMIGGISGAYDPYAFSMGAASAPGQKQFQAEGAPAAQPGGGQKGTEAAKGAAGAGDDQKVKKGYKSSPADCQTCKERKYQDGSNESDVSFKAPGHIAPEASAATVMAHEKQHVANAYQKAAKNDGQVVSCSVSLHTAVCPECGTAYVSGGTTSTSISYPNESNPYQQNKKAQDAIRLTGANIDYAA